MMVAPRAHCDDEWQNFSEFKTGLEQGARINLTKLFADEATGMLENVPELDNSFSSKIGSFKSMEDLANGFDEKLTECFQNFNTKTHRTDPVDLINEDTIMRSDEIWNALTDNYGKVMAVDWKQSRTRSLHLPALTLEGRPRAPRCVRELLDDEELRDQMDMHSIIVSCLNDEPLFTAEQVIEEIEGMMLDSPEMETEQNPSQPDLSLDKHCFRTSLTFEQRVRTLCVAELNELLEEVETAIRRDSELLIQHLALRDELDFEKEVKNSFISVLIDIQNRQKEHREALRKKRRPKGGSGTPQGRSERPAGSFFSMEGLSSAIQNGFRQTFGSGASERQYLTTVIPYEEKGGPPSVQDLQILTNILQAMRDDSDKVPSLLTDYILKVLCPT